MSSIPEYNIINPDTDDLGVIKAKIEAIAKQVDAGEVSKEDFDKEIAKLNNSQKGSLEAALGKPLGEWP